VQGSAMLTVPALLSITVTPEFPSITGTNTQQFTATGTYSDSTTQNLTNSVTWASSAPGVATIGATGLAAGVAPGTTTISAALGAVTGNMVLTVNPPPGLLGNSVTFTTSETGSVTITPLGGPSSPEVVNGGSIFGFCVGPNADNCVSSGVSGSVTITANQVSFTFFGSTDPATGTFVIQINGFTTTINNVTYDSGALAGGTFGLTSFTTNSMTFTGTASGAGFNAIGGITITFDVS